MKNFLILFLTMFIMLVFTACSSDDKNSTVENCELLCSKIVSCYEKQEQENEDNLSQYACNWVKNSDKEKCKSSCNESYKDIMDSKCIDCLSERLVCSTTGPLRPCDSACDATDYVTGHDFEGAAEYSYWEYFCDIESE